MKNKRNLKILENVAKESFGKISESMVFLGLCSENYIDDPICLLQLSISIMLDKPIFLLIEKGVKIPKKLIRLLDGYMFYDKDDDKSFEEASDKLLLKIQHYL